MFQEIAEVLKGIGASSSSIFSKNNACKGPTNVTTMYGDLQMPQSTISQHLSKLKR